MTNVRKKRLLLLLGGVLAVALATAFVLRAFKDNLAYFYTPTQIVGNQAPLDRFINMGGLVKQGSLRYATSGLQVDFVVTDTVADVPVAYSGVLPDLFKEGKGTVVKGKFDGKGQFVASDVLAKHDENYMPPAAKDAVEQTKQASRTLIKP